jgi:hypothetical protein
MKQTAKNILYFSLLISLILFNAGCRKEKLNDPPLLSSTNHSTNQSQTDSNVTRPGEFIFENLPWRKDSLYSLPALYKPFENLIRNADYDTDYYKKNVKVFIRFSTWTPIPYEAHDHNGAGPHALYFTDDNYYVNVAIFGYPAGTRVAGRIVVYAKPDTAIDFSKRVSVKVVIRR